MKENDLRKQLDKSFRQDFWRYFIKHPIKAIKSWYYVRTSEEYKNVMKYTKIKHGK